MVVSATFAQGKEPAIVITGAMKNVMWHGQLHGTINLDTISKREHLYGLGPIEGLRGEIIIIDGRSYTSYVTSPTTMKVVEEYGVKAPFFAHGYVKEWKEVSVPEHIITIMDLESYLGDLTKSRKEPFFFKITGVADEASIHVVNLPEGAVVTNPDEAHKGQVSYEIANQQVVIVGFYSKNHKAVFTHHDTFIHLHLMTADKSKMGHVDALKLKKGAVKLYLPK